MKIFLHLGVFFLWLVNLRRADDEAWWDDAQDFAERLCGKDHRRTKKLAYVFEVLHSRLSERTTDLMRERLHESCRRRLQPLGRAHG